MKKSIFVLGRDDDRANLRLLAIIVAAAIFSKGVVLFRGFSIDDYSLGNGVDDKALSLFFSQGRYLMALIFGGLESLGVNAGDLFFPLGLLVLVLQSAFVVSVFRFVGVERLPAAGLVGALVVAHPYLAEILTFRLVLPSYCAALMFSIVTLEALVRHPSTWRGRSVALLATLAMVFTYQVFLNYFAIAIAFALLLAFLSERDEGRPALFSRQIYWRVVDLIAVSLISGLLFLIATGLARYYGINGDVDRAKTISVAEFPERTRQVYSALANIYWMNEPVYSGWMKVLVAAVILFSIVIILWRIVLTTRIKGAQKYAVLSLFILVLFIPLSIGLIVAFRTWWPVPRVVAHVSMLLGLILLSADFCLKNFAHRGLKFAASVSRGVILVGFVFLSNQILIDQQRLNDWDRLMANRILSRLETLPNFNEIRYVSISGGAWAFPKKLRTIQGDLNVSSFYPEYSKVALLSEISGYELKNADASGVAKAEEYCKGRQTWPHADSLAIFGDLAVVCLKKVF